MSPSSSSSPTTFEDIHPHIIQTHILPHLDGQSLSTVATTSSYLRTLCADQTLWSNICKSIWPSITHSHVDDIISTFPTGHKSLFQDSFSPLLNLHYQQEHCPSTRLYPSQLISAVDIRYKEDIIYSNIEFTNTTTDHFMSSPFRVKLNSDIDHTHISKPIDLKVDESLDADDTTITHLKESVTLSWILINPDQKQAFNLSSIKPVLVWTTNEIYLRYVIVLPGIDPNEIVECRIEVRLVVGDRRVGLQVKNVTLHMQDVTCNCLSGKNFLVILRRKMVVGQDGQYKKLRKEENKSGLVTNVGYNMSIVSLLIICLFYFFSSFY